MRRKRAASSAGKPLEYTPGRRIELDTIVRPVTATSSQISRCPTTPTMPPSMHRRPITALPEITRSQIEHFFQHYKDLEPGKWVKILHWGDVNEARRYIVEAIARGKKA